MFIVNQAEGKYDNRTLKNYVECLLNNGWLFIEGETLLPFFTASTSIFKYKRIKFRINPDGKAEGRKKEDVLNEILQDEKKSLSDKAIERAQKATEPSTAHKNGKEVTELWNRKKNYSNIGLITPLYALETRIHQF